MWYHILNCGFPLKVSGETDFPCMSGERVGQAPVQAHAIGRQTDLAHPRRLGDPNQLDQPAMQQGLAEEVQPQARAVRAALARHPTEDVDRDESKRPRELLSRAEDATLVAVIGDFDVDALWKERGAARWRIHAVQEP